jgi:hypothetical protein
MTARWRRWCWYGADREMGPACGSDQDNRDTVQWPCKRGYRHRHRLLGFANLPDCHASTGATEDDSQVKRTTRTIDNTSDRWPGGNDADTNQATAHSDLRCSHWWHD